MFLVHEINPKDVDLCIELDAKSINLWNKKQWIDLFNNKGVKVLALFLSTKVIGVTVYQVIVDEAQLHYFSILPEFRRNGYGSHLMKKVVHKCENLNLKKILLEVSESNKIAEKFYSHFDFYSVGRRTNYYKDGSHAVLKEKILLK